MGQPFYNENRGFSNMEVKKEYILAVFLLSFVVPVVLSIIWRPNPVYLLHILAFWFIFGPAIHQSSISRFLIFIFISGLIVYGFGYGYYVLSSSWQFTRIRWSISDYIFVTHMLYPFILNLIVGLIFIGLPFCINKWASKT